MPYLLEELYSDTAQIQNDDFSLFGSGRLIGQNMVLTARHVLVPKDSTVTVKDGWQVRLEAGRPSVAGSAKWTWVKANVEWAGQGALDLALLRLFPDPEVETFRPRLQLRIGRIDEVQHHRVRGLGFPRGAKVDDRRTLFVPSGDLDDQKGSALRFGIDQEYQPESPHEDWRGFSGAAIVLESSRLPDVVWIYGVAQQVPQHFTRALDIARLGEAWGDEEFRSTLEAAGIVIEPPLDPIARFPSQYHFLYQKDLNQHWKPRAMGSAAIHYTGRWYFTGRTAALQKIVRWLGESSSGGSARVVTGDPGSGKSAVLGYIVTASDPKETSNPMLSQFLGYMPDGTRPPVGCIDFALYLKGKTLPETQAALASYLRVKPDAILAALATREQKTVLVFDGLEEAADSEKIADELLRPLTGYRHVWLLIGCQRPELPLLGPRVEYIDLDREDFQTDTHIASYVEQVLLAKGEPRENPYQGNPEAARKTANAIADTVKGNFLVAHVITRYLVEREAIVDPDQEQIPIRAQEAFDRYLSALGERLRWEEQRLRRVLRPLAYAEGQGFPREVWERLAKDNTGEEVAAVLKVAFAFIRDYQDGDHLVYRYYHEALAEALRDPQTDGEQQHRIVATLSQTVPAGDWSRADWYIRKHLAQHAAKAGLLADLMNDPLYLMTADSSHLLSTLDSYPQPGIRNIVHSYKAAVNYILRTPTAEAASYLEMVARQSGAIKLADKAAALSHHREWRSPWAVWTPRTTSRAIAKDGEISVLTAVLDGAQPLALVGRKDGYVEVWRVDKGERLSIWRPEGVEYATHLAFVDTLEGRLLIAAWFGGQLGVINLDNGRSVLHSDKGEEARVTGLCTTKRAGKHVCVTAHYDLTLAVWDLPDLNLVQEKPIATRPNIYCLSVYEDESGSWLVSAGDSLEKQRDKLDGKLRLWSPEDLSLMWEDPRKDRGVLEHVDSGVFLGRKLLITSQNNWGPTEIWDMRLKRVLFRGATPTSRSWVVEIGGQTLLLDERYSELNVYRLALSSEDENATLVATRMQDGIPIQGSSFSGILNLRDGPVLLSVDLNCFRVWNLSELLAEGAEQKHGNGESLAVSSASASRGELCIGTQDGTVAGFDPETGVLLWKNSVGRNRVVLAAAGESLTEGLIAAEDGMIHVFDTNSPRAVIHSFKAGSTITRLKAGQWLGRHLVFVSAQNGRTWSIRIWDVDTGQSVETGRNYHLSGGQEDKEINGLAVIENGNSLRIGFASKYGKAMVADLDDLDPTSAKFPDFQEWYVPGGGGGYIHALAAGRYGNELLLAAGTEYGDISVLDFLNQDVKWWVPGAHVRGIPVLSFNQINNRTMLVSGGLDGVVRFWTARTGTPLLDIEIGEAITAATWVGATNLAVGTHRGVLMLQLSHDVITRLLD